MNLYAFELGRIKELSIAEIKSLLGEESVEEVINNYAIVRTEHELTQNLQDRIGGTIKIIRILEENSTPPNNPSQFEQVLQDHIKAILFSYVRNKNTSGKTIFGVNIINIPGDSKLILKNLLNFSKKFLKASTIPSRFINKPWSNTTSAQVYKSKILAKGLEISLIYSQKSNKIYVGHTKTIQDIDSYSYRDYKKPKRDAHLGMLPPKLAQIMINLAQDSTKPISEVIYDPFCGTGTVLSESLLMGKDAYGSDIQEKMAQASKENCEWIAKKFHINPDRAFDTFTSDASQLKQENIPENLSAIITEGYLGKPQSSIVPKEKRDEIIDELSELHLSWLSNIRPLIKPGTKIVMCLTAFNTHDGIEHISGFDTIASKAGFKIQQKYTYFRPDQIILRDIVILV